MLYLVLGFWWWPALIAGVVTAVAGYARVRTAVAALADLMEASVDIHQKALAEALGVQLRDGRITPAEAPQINDLCNKIG